VRVEHGSGPAGLPFHRFGTGNERLVIVPGIMDSLGWNTPGAVTAHLLARYYFRRLREYDVWVLSRPPGLPAGITAETMAEQYADALDELGSAHLLGFSLGGAIGSHLAATRPDLVDRLILAGAAHRLGSYGETIMARWREFAEQQEWASLHVEYSRTVYAGGRRIILPPLYRLGARFLPDPVSTGDVTASITAAQSYDGRTVLPDVTAPMLVLGGRDDVLYPAGVRTEAARLATDGYVVTLPGGHAVYEESSRQFGTAVRQFLEGDSS